MKECALWYLVVPLPGQECWIARGLSSLLITIDTQLCGQKGYIAQENKSDENGIALAIKGNQYTKSWFFEGVWMEFNTCLEYRISPFSLGWIIVFMLVHLILGQCDLCD